MTDATRLALVAKLGKTISSMGLDDFRMTEKDYIEKRIVATKLAQSMNEMGKLLAEEFGDEVADRMKRRMADEVFVPVWRDVE